MSVAYIDLLDITRTATGTIREGRAVTYAGAEVSAAGARCLGIAKTEATAGREISVQVHGVAKAVAGAEITVGQALSTDNQGRLVPATAVSVSVNAGATGVTSSAANGAITTVAGGALPAYVVGHALSAASGAGVEFQVLLR